MEYSVNKVSKFYSVYSVEGQQMSKFDHSQGIFERLRRRRYFDGLPQGCVVKLTLFGQRDLDTEYINIGSLVHQQFRYQLVVARTLSLIVLYVSPCGVFPTVSIPVIDYNFYPAGGCSALGREFVQTASYSATCRA